MIIWRSCCWNCRRVKHADPGMRSGAAWYVWLGRSICSVLLCDLVESYGSALSAGMWCGGIGVGELFWFHCGVMWCGVVWCGVVWCCLLTIDPYKGRAIQAYGWPIVMAGRDWVALWHVPIESPYPHHIRARTDSEGQNIRGPCHASTLHFAPTSMLTFGPTSIFHSGAVMELQVLMAQMT